MSKTKIIIDTSSCFDPQLAKKYDLALFPYKILRDEKVYTEFKDIDTEEIYDFLEEEFLHTTMPSTGEFQEFVKSYLDEGYEKFLVIPVSKNISGLMQMTRLAFESMDDARLKEYKVLDTKSGGPVTAVCALLLNEEIKKGNDDLDYLSKKANYILAEKSEVYLLLRSLQNLAKGGRIPKSLSNIGDMVKLNTILTVEDGALKPCKKVFGDKKSLKQFIELSKKRVKKSKKYIALIAHARDFKDYEIMKDGLKEELENAELVIEMKLSSVLTTHLGLETIGFGFVSLD